MHKKLTLKTSHITFKMDVTREIGLIVSCNESEQVTSAINADLVQEMSLIPQSALHLSELPSDQFLIQ